MIKKTGAEIVAQMLETYGIETLAGIPGGANLPLYDALSRQKSFRHVLARHEQGAGFIAQGMSRITGKAAVCLGTSGPGATNLLTAIADARLDSIPMVCITGQVPSAMIGTDAFQEIDTYGMTIPITKHNFLVRDAAELLKVIPKAFEIAESGRPGPVVIDIPKDIQLAEVEFEAWPEINRDYKAGENGFSKEIETACEMMKAAKKPVIYAGGGIIQSNTAQHLQKLAEMTNTPVTTTLMGLGAMPHNHPLAIGMLGMHGARYTNLAIAECDLLIALGSRFDDRATGKLSEFCKNAKVIHVDIDSAELGKNRKPDLGIQTDLAEFMPALVNAATNMEHNDWLEYIANLKAENPPERKGCENPATGYGVISATAEFLNDDAIIVTDVGQHQMWTAQVYPFTKPKRWLTSGGLGTMGFGLPAAIGAALADPEATVVCFSGDGSLLMNIQELATMADTKANVKVIVLNNQTLGLVHQQQELFYGERFMASEFETAPDFAMVATGFGIKSYDLGKCSDIKETLKEVLTTRGPALINTPISAAESVFPMVAPGAGNNEMIGE